MRLKDKFCSGVISTKTGLVVIYSYQPVNQADYTHYAIGPQLFSRNQNYLIGRDELFDFFFQFGLVLRVKT